MAELSVVIAAHDASSAIEECLAALLAQRSSAIHEIIVADSSTDGTEVIVRGRFPTVRLLHFAEALTLPELRARGIQAASGDLIAILDPYSIADRHWAEALIAEHEARSNPIIGGTVDLSDADGQGLLAWARYINEYGMFMPPMGAGPMDILPGSNLSYKRVALLSNAKFRRDEFWKTFVNESAEAAGAALWLAPSVAVALKKPIPFRDYFRTRFDHGRCYAGMRVAGHSWVEKWLRSASAPLLPFVLLWRTGRRYWSKKHHRGKLLTTLPLQLLLFGNWALGELVGYLRGPGKSCKRLFY
ncbi:MAG: glycosyltransferase [Chloroflexota bacterium]